MANQEKKVTSVVVTPTIKRYPVTNSLRRIVKTLVLDNDNIIIAIDDKADPDMIDAAFYDRELDIYEERKALYEAVLLGDKQLPEEKVYPSLGITENMEVYGSKCYFYTAPHNLREMKNALSGAFGLVGNAHGHYTMIGVLQFSVSNATPNEVHKFLSLYPELFKDLPVGVQPYDLNESKAKSVDSTSKRKAKSALMPRGMAKPSVTINPSERPVTENKDTVTVSKATPEQLELARKIREANNQ